MCVFYIFARGSQESWLSQEREEFYVLHSAVSYESANKNIRNAVEKSKGKHSLSVTLFCHIMCIESANQSNAPQ